MSSIGTRCPLILVSAAVGGKVLVQILTSHVGSNLQEGTVTQGGDDAIVDQRVDGGGDASHVEEERHLRMVNGHLGQELRISCEKITFSSESMVLFFFQ